MLALKTVITTAENQQSAPHHDFLHFLQCSVTEVKQWLHLKLSVSSVSYLYTHLNYVESGLGRFVMGNLI